jgi:hypothetical protein
MYVLFHGELDLPTLDTITPLRPDNSLFIAIF